MELQACFPRDCGGLATLLSILYIPGTNTQSSNIDTYRLLGLVIMFGYGLKKPWHKRWPPYLTGKGVPSARCRIIFGSRCCRVPHVVALSSPTMTQKSTSDSSSIFKDGKLKPGIYKIQNLCSGTYLDIHPHSREVCCRPAGDLEDGRGIVCLLSAICGSHI